MAKHVVQSHLWGKFKNLYGTEAVEAGNVLYTKHKIPFSGDFVAYCPRVNPADIDFPKLIESAKENDCIAVNFDVPNVVSGTPEEKEALNIFDQNNCVKSTRDQFAKGNVLLDLRSSEEELLGKMHKKHRYNIGLAERKGVTVRLANGEEDFNKFYDLYKETGQRQKYFFRPRVYLKSVYDLFKAADNSAEILLSEYNGQVLAGWMFILCDGVIYYPYGGSSTQVKEAHASTLLAWEGIKLGKSRNCHTFDMWGTSVDPLDESDSYFGFTNFKMRFGGQHVVYMDSYDLVINPGMYKFFNAANNIRWRLLRASR